VKNRVFVIGASLSGIDTLRRLISSLPADFQAPILITQHVASHSPSMLPELLDRPGREAVHPKDGATVESGKVYVAPPDRHMLLRHGYIRLSHGPQENLARPSVDPLFRSAAMSYGPAAVGVVLTGQLDDGTAGLLAIKDRGGVTVVQDPSQATASSMPLSALRSVSIDHCCKIEDMGKLFLALELDDPGQSPPDLSRAMEIENRIAEGIFGAEDWWVLEQLSSPSGLNCPSCRSPLYELNDKRVLRFRCRAGHAFSARSLLSGQAVALEHLLSSTFGVLMEEISLSTRLVDTDSVKAEAEFVQRLRQRIADLQAEVAIVRDWLHSMTGLVDPEPTHHLAETPVHP
jgi:two-component system chemotaxis response regulator CheB